MRILTIRKKRCKITVKIIQDICGIFLNRKLKWEEAGEHTWQIY